MSRTYHHGRKHNPRAENNRPHWEQMTTPNEWNREMTGRPNRAKERMVARRCEMGFDADNEVWPLAKKPQICYW
jgi:hypothetical protein